MDRYFLVDFENVGSDGLKGCDKLTHEDHILLFYTNNTKKIEIDILVNHGQATFDWQDVPAGKQSADMHIGSYLGYLAGSHPDNDCEVVIISKDTDYDKLIRYWKARGVKASRSQKLKATAPRTATSPQGSKGASAASKSKASSSSAAISQGSATFTQGSAAASQRSGADRSNEKTALNNEIQQILSKANFSSDVINHVASIVAKNANAQNNKQQIYRAIISKFGQQQGLNIYNHVKKHI